MVNNKIEKYENFQCTFFPSSNYFNIVRFVTSGVNIFDGCGVVQNEWSSINGCAWLAAAHFSVSRRRGIRGARLFWVMVVWQLLRKYVTIKRADNGPITSPKCQAWNLHARLANEGVLERWVGVCMESNKTQNLKPHCVNILPTK